MTESLDDFDPFASLTVNSAPTTTWATASPEEIIRTIQAYKRKIREDYLNPPRRVSEEHVAIPEGYSEHAASTLMGLSVVESEQTKPGTMIIVSEDRAYDTRSHIVMHPLDVISIRCGKDYGRRLELVAEYFAKRAGVLADQAIARLDNMFIDVADVYGTFSGSVRSHEEQLRLWKAWNEQLDDAIRGRWSQPRRPWWKRLLFPRWYEARRRYR